MTQRFRFHRFALFCRILMCLWMLTLTRAAFCQPPQRPTNFIIILCDNLGYGDIEPFGSELHRTPNLNRMAREGRKFTHFYVSAGVCTPSRASLLTGCYAQRIGMHDNPRDGQVLRPVSPYGLNPEETTIAEVLKEQGYATALIGKWHLGDQPCFLPTRQGFDHYFGIPYSDDMTEATGQRLGLRFQGHRWPPLPLVRNEIVIEAPVDRDGLTSRYTNHAIEWIREHRAEPFFLLLSQAMPGSTKSPFSSSQFRGRSRNGAWGDAVEELDWSTGQILDCLVDLNLSENTLVVWTSDNGAPINPDDLSRGSNQPLHGRGYTTSEGAFRVPTIVWQPGRIPASSTCEQFLSTMDLLPTLAAIAGSTYQPKLPIDGQDMSRLFFADPVPELPDRPFAFYQMDELQAVRYGPWKLFLPVPFTRHPHFRTGQTPRPLLFNLYDDVSCEHDVSGEHPELVKQLTELAQQARTELGDRGTSGQGQRPPGKIDGEPQPLVKK